ncbi:phosphatase PAP2 family protein [Polycladidibacter stylochi]|uniref:phosphatase PAP2 family protein n=1 Tax=Polycladidibacter stylochi TaxID=1807766 RepID=UPI0009E6C016|nr:phosphatase PAP2 family protein [Pseudovibrio stylochi]
MAKNSIIKSSLKKAGQITSGLLGWCKLHPFAATSALLAIIATIFIAFPGLDTAITGLFYNGSIFPVAHSYLGNKIRFLAVNLILYAAIFCLLLLLWKLVFPRTLKKMDLRAPIFLLTTLALGPGLVVNIILKEYWGRPRPRNTDIFGGQLPFTGIWPPTDLCNSNCSFVSGEGSASFWLLAFTLIVPKAYKLPTAIFTGSLCLLFSLNRIAFGGHFTSDTLMSWGITALIIIAVHHYLYVAPPAWARPKTLNNSMTQAGISLNTNVRSAHRSLRKRFHDFIDMFRQV